MQNLPKRNLIKEKEIMIDHHGSIRQAIIQNNELGAASAMRSQILETQSNYSKSIQNK
jgi:DNA-binding GntR family transcriptional regulator